MSANTEEKAHPPGADESGVRAVFGEVSKAWAAGDTEEFVSYYTDEATATLPGFHLVGKDHIRTSMGGAFAGQLKNSQRIHNVERVRFLSLDTAIVTTRSATQFPGESEPAADRWSVATWVLARHESGWLIEAYHECPAS
jgi:uncharacterized protein (TIGR02246 family)